MKTMKIEKHLVYVDQIQKVHHLQVSEGLTYQNESEGMRAVGPLYIKGEYETAENGRVPFEEVLEMDVLAPNAKLGDTPFQLRVEEFEAQPDSDGVDLTIYLSIHGLKEVDAKEEIAQHHEELTKPFHEEETFMQMPVSEPEKEVMAQAVEENEEVVEPITASELDGFEDLFEDSGTTYTSYRMVVAKPQDTYHSIAQRYDVEEEALRNANHNKEVQSKTLVILPFSASNA